MHGKPEEKVEWRKHINQMTKWEVARLKLAITNVDVSNYRPSEYCQNRINLRQIDIKDIQRVITYGKIIEFHFKDGCKRVLIRGIEKVNGNSVCVVIDIKSKEIVTVYNNDGLDEHRTLHKELYNGRMDLMKYLSFV